MSTAYRECFTCSKIEYCAQTSTKRMLKSYVCRLFEPASDVHIYARSLLLNAYNPITAVRALLKREDDPSNQELVEMSLDFPNAGTSYSERKKQLELMAFMDVRLLGTKKYKDQSGQPILDWNETLVGEKRDQSIARVLEFELANNIIVPDAAVQQSAAQPQGAPQMAQSPFQPPQMPPQMPQQQAPQQMPMPPAPPRPPQMPQMMPQAPQAPYGMVPQPQPGMPQAPNFPPPPPPPGFPQPPQVPAAPVQAAQVPQEAPPAPATGGKKKRGAVAAPPPPPPPPAPAQAPQQYAMPQQQFAMPPQAPAAWSPPTSQPMPPQQPQQAAAGVDLSPVLAQVDLVGKAVNALGAADQESLKQLTTILADIKTLVFVQVACLQHIYLGQPHLQQSIAGKELNDVPKFVAYMQQFLPR